MDARVLLGILAVHGQRDGHAGGRVVGGRDARSQHQALVEHVVGQQLGQAGVLRQRIAAPQHFQRQPGAADGGIDLGFTVGLCSRRQIARQFEGDLGFDAHDGALRGYWRGGAEMDGGCVDGSHHGFFGRG